MSPKHPAFPLVVAAVIAVGGCTRLGMGGPSSEPLTPAPLNPAPVGGVTAGTLPPPPGVDAGGGMVGAGSGDAGFAVAATGTGSRPTQEDLLGSWTITNGSDSCQLNLSLTSWTGGYRASTRGCYGAELTSISAWRLEGGHVVLLSDGQQLGQLAQTAATRFDGTLGSMPVTVYRR
jgi:hypothetical protein